ncbi:ndr1/hin1-like protein 3 [Quercus suber]|uniref:Ndr1/hin1-like protein 3 n=1 Tax=Quercus suber TaxID=58331 RepID=A0AAW0LAG7_QUESU
MVKYGFKITFVNIEIIHERVVGALDSLVDSNVNLVSIPDGLGAEDGRNDLGKISLKLNLRIRPKLGWIKVWTFKPKVKCGLNVPLKSNGTSSIAFETTKCSYDL